MLRLMNRTGRVVLLVVLAVVLAVVVWFGLSSVPAYD